MKKSILFFILFLFSSSGVYAANLISNPSFESGDTSWKANNSSVIFEASQSAKISNTKTSSYGIEQILTDISPSLSYKISASVKLISPYPDKAFLRVAWYKSTDASGSQSSTDDSSYAVETDDWQKIEFIKTPPDGISSAKLRLLVASGSAYFDNAAFEEYFAEIPTPTPTLIPDSTPTLSPTTAPISYDNIYLSEVMVNPLTGEDEWIELYNDNDFAVSLTGWYIDDAADSGSSAKIFSLDIPAKGYSVFELTSSIFNNDEDTVRLLDTGKNQKDAFQYIASEKNYSLGRTSWQKNLFCNQTPSKGIVNNNCIVATPMISPAPSIKMINSTTQNKPASTTTIHPVMNSGSPFNEPSQNQPAVLGEETRITDQPSVGNLQPTNLIKFFSSLSITYSLLTIVSLLLKMK